MKHNESYMYNINSLLENFDLENKIVLVRIDANVPMEQGKILDDFKIEAVKDTLMFIVKKGACCIVLTHISNPQEPKEELSTKQLMPWFQLYFDTQHACNFEQLGQKEKKPGTVILFENLRFFKEEKTQDISFAQALVHASRSDFYVNDAFGTLHRLDTSITILPLQFPEKRRTIGFLVEKELKMYNKLLLIKPSLLIVGGGKPETKISLVIECATYIDTVLLCPALSEIEKKSLLSSVIYPVDYNFDDKVSPKAYRSIGPKTIQMYQQYIQRSRLIIWNGFMGFLQNYQSLKASKQLAASIENSGATTIVAGTDTCNFVRYYTDEPSKISYFSTGGGASLAVIARKRLLSLEPFL